MEEKIVGGKAYNLDILTKNGINIPKWLVVTSPEEYMITSPQPSPKLGEGVFVGFSSSENDSNPISQKGEKALLVKGTFIAGLGLGARLLFELRMTGLWWMN